MWETWDLLASPTFNSISIVNRLIIKRIPTQALRKDTNSISKERPRNFLKKPHASYNTKPRSHDKRKTGRILSDCRLIYCGLEQSWVPQTSCTHPIRGNSVYLGVQRLQSFHRDGDIQKEEGAHNRDNDPLRFDSNFFRQIPNIQIQMIGSQ